MFPALSKSTMLPDVLVVPALTTRKASMDAVILLDPDIPKVSPFEFENTSVPVFTDSVPADRPMFPP
jgi:hypothetical protein